MSNEPLNTMAFQQFIQQVKSADSSNAKEVKLSMQQAKNLAYTLGIAMSRLNGDLEKLLINNNTKEEVIEVKIDGGSGFKD